jgi:hypothetical protein
MSKRKFLHLVPLVIPNTLEDLQARIFNFDVERLRYILFATFHIHPCIRKRLHSCQTVMKHSAYLFLFEVKNYIGYTCPHLHIPSCSSHLNRCLRKRKLIDYTSFSFKERKVCMYKTARGQIRPKVTNALIFRHAFLLRDTLQKHQNVTVYILSVHLRQKAA